MIHAVEKRSDEKGDVVEYFILDMLLGDMKIMIPIKNVEQVGLRHVISEEQLVDIEDVLTSRPENKMKSITWNRREATARKRRQNVPT